MSRALSLAKLTGVRQAASNLSHCASSCWLRYIGYDLREVESHSPILIGSHLGKPPEVLPGSCDSHVWCRTQVRGALSAIGPTLQTTNFRGGSTLTTSFLNHQPFRLTPPPSSVNTAKMGRVRTKTVKKSAKVIIERYYPKLTLDFETNKRICDEIAIIASKRLRNKVRRYNPHRGPREKEEEC